MEPLLGEENEIQCENSEENGLEIGHISEPDRVVAKEIWNGTQDRGLRKQPRLTERGKEYKRTELIRQRTSIKATIRSRIETYKGLLANESNYEHIKNNYRELEEQFKHFAKIHGNIQPLLDDFGQSLDISIYDDTHHEVYGFLNDVQNWLKSVDQKGNNEQHSVRFKSVSGHSSHSSKRSTVSSTKQRAIQAKARMAEMKSRLDNLESVETARKKAERAELEAEFATAAAVSKVYDDALNEENEQYLGSDDPDIGNDPRLDVTENVSNQSVHDENIKSNQRPMTPNHVSRTVTSSLSDSLLDRRININAADIFKPPSFFSTTLKGGNNTGQGDISDVMAKGNGNNGYTEKMVPLNNSVPVRWSTPKHSIEVNSTYSSLLQQTSLLEKMELRMSQPPPKPVPFDGNPIAYLRFRSNFREQVESRNSLTDGEKMNYLLSYTSGRAKQAIESNQGLLNSCQLSLNVLYRRFGQPSMIVEALKSNVIYGDKVKPGDGAALLDLADKLENCCHIMDELNSTELRCTTNMKHVYDRLPDTLQAKWRRIVKLHRERNAGCEPTLHDLSRFISEESQSENDPVYGRKIDTRNKTYNQARSRPVPAPRTRIPTLATSFELMKIGESEPQQENQSNTKGICSLCHEGSHALDYCSVFLSKSASWRRKFAKSELLCYLCLSNTHVRKDCMSKVNCNAKGCKSPGSHHKLLHYEPTKSDGNAKAAAKTAVNTATMDNKHNFVQLKVVPVCVTGENGFSLCSYGLLDTAAASSMITNKLANRLQLQETPEKVAISTVTHSNKECELSSVNFTLNSAVDSSISFPVRALTVKTLNVSQNYRPGRMDISEWPHLATLSMPNCHIDLDEVSVLIGQDVPQAHTVSEYVWGDNPQRQPYATKTPFGWCVAGPLRNNQSDKMIALSILECHVRQDVLGDGNLEPHTCLKHEPRDLDKCTDISQEPTPIEVNVNQEVPTVGILEQQVEKFWTLDEHRLEDVDDITHDYTPIGVNVTQEVPTVGILEQQVEKFWTLEQHGFEDVDEYEYSADDLKALEILNKTTHLANDKYEVGLLWKSEMPTIPDNRPMAERDFNNYKGVLIVTLNLLLNTRT